MGFERTQEPECNTADCELGFELAVAACVCRFEVRLSMCRGSQGDAQMYLVRHTNTFVDHT